MSSKPLRPCRRPGCCTLVPDGYCDLHRPPPRPDSRSDESKRWRWMYKTDLWIKKLRPEQLAREPFCRACANHGGRVRATDVDHIQDHKGSWALFSDPENLQSLCHSCHSRKTIADQREFAKKKRR